MLILFCSNSIRLRHHQFVMCCFIISSTECVFVCVKCKWIAPVWLLSREDSSERVFYQKSSGGVRSSERPHRHFHLANFAAMNYVICVVLSHLYNNSPEGFERSQIEKLRLLKTLFNGHQTHGGRLLKSKTTLKLKLILLVSWPSCRADKYLWLTPMNAVLEIFWKDG